MLWEKSPLTRPGIDPGTFRLVAQRFNHYANPGATVPHWTSLISTYLFAYLLICLFVVYLFIYKLICLFINLLYYLLIFVYLILIYTFISVFIYLLFIYLLIHLHLGRDSSVDIATS